jgi:MFS family permease
MTIFYTYSPFFSFRQVELGLSTSDTTVAMTLNAATFTLGCLQANYLAEIYGSQTITKLALAMMAPGFFLLGPSSVLHTDNFWVHSVGLAITGLSISTVYQLSAPTLVTLARKEVLTRFKGRNEEELQ